MTKKVIAMVPVRAGSTRVPDKNIRPFADTSLLQLKLQLLSHVDGISEVIVSTDCNVSAEIATNSGMKVQWRDNYYAGSHITNDLHWHHIAETTPGDIVFLAQVTSPLIKVSTMQKALDKFKKLTAKDSLNSVSVEKKFLWKDAQPLNYNIDVTPKSQDLPDIFSLNFAITIISKEIMMERKNVVGYNPEFLDLDKVEALDVDDELDFKIAEIMYKDLGIQTLLS